MSEQQPRHGRAPNFTTSRTTPTATDNGDDASSGSNSQNSSRAPSQRSMGSASRYSEQFDAYSTAAGTASSDTGIGSEASYARHYLRTGLRQPAHDTAFAQRVAIDAKTAVVSRKLVTSSIGAAMEGISIVFRGNRGTDTLAGWQTIAGDSATPNKKTPAKALDATGFTKLGYIEKGKADSLAQIGNEHLRQQQVLATARCFGTLIEQLEGLSAAGAVQRQRIVTLGGAQLLTSACRFIRDEDLLLKCVTCIFRLAHDFALRRRLVSSDVRAPEALAAVICRPHIPEVVSMTLDCLNLMCLEGDVTETLPGFGVLTAIYTLCLKVSADEVPVLHSATTLLKTMSRYGAPARGYDWGLRVHCFGLGPQGFIL